MNAEAGQRPLWPDEALMLAASRTPETDALEAWADVYYVLEDEAVLWAAKDTQGRWIPLLGGRGAEYAARLNALLEAFPEIPVSEGWPPYTTPMVQVTAIQGSADG